MNNNFFNNPEDNIIAYRIMYYYPEKVRKSLHDILTIPDSEYDRLERELAKECFLLNMIEVDFKNPRIKKVFKAIRA